MCIPRASADDTVVKFGTIEEIWDADISPDGTNLALGCSQTGVRGICIYDVSRPSSPKVIIPNEGARITEMFWPSPDYLVYSINTYAAVQHSTGLHKERIDRLIAYRLADGNSVILMNDVDGLLNATHIESFFMRENDTILMSVTYWDDYGKATGSHINNKGRLTFVPLKVDLNTGKTKPYKRSSRSLSGAVYDAFGEKVVEIVRHYESKIFEIHAVQDKRRVIFRREKAELSPLQIRGLNGSRDSVIVDFDDGEREGLSEIALADGAITPFQVDGRRIGDAGLVNDQYNSAVVGYYFTDDTSLVTYTDTELASIQTTIKDALGIPNVWLMSWTKDRSTFTVSATPLGRPTQYFLFDAEALSLSSIGGAAPWLNNAELGEIQKITYEAGDGLPIPAYLTLPSGKTISDGPHPLVLMPHGGPEALTQQIITGSRRHFLQQVMLCYSQTIADQAVMVRPSEIKGLVSLVA